MTAFDAQAARERAERALHPKRWHPWWDDSGLRVRRYVTPNEKALARDVLALDAQVTALREALEDEIDMEDATRRLLMRALTLMKIPDDADDAYEVIDSALENLRPSDDTRALAAVPPPEEGAELLTDIDIIRDTIHRGVWELRLEAFAALSRVEARLAAYEQALARIEHFPFDVNSDAASDLRTVKEIARAVLDAQREAGQ